MLNENQNKTWGCARRMCAKQWGLKCLLFINLYVNFVKSSNLTVRFVKSKKTAVLSVKELFTVTFHSTILVGNCIFVLRISRLVVNVCMWRREPVTLTLTSFSAWVDIAQLYKLVVGAKCCICDILPSKSAVSVFSTLCSVLLFGPPRNFSFGKERRPTTAEGPRWRLPEPKLIQDIRKASLFVWGEEEKTPHGGENSGQCD